MVFPIGTRSGSVKTLTRKLVLCCSTQAGDSGGLQSTNKTSLNLSDFPALRGLTPPIRQYASHKSSKVYIKTFSFILSEIQNEWSKK